METFTQVTLILIHLFSAALGFATIGKTPAGDNKRPVMAWSIIIDGLFTIGMLIWWETNTAVELYAKCAVLALMWVPTFWQLRGIDKPHNEYTTRRAVLNAISCAMTIGAVLAFWVL